MYVRAKTNFNYGGIVVMKGGEYLQVKDDIAKKLIDMGYVVENKPSHKKIKIKDVIVDKTKDEESE